MPSSLPEYKNSPCFSNPIEVTLDLCAEKLLTCFGVREVWSAIVVRPRGQNTKNFSNYRLLGLLRTTLGLLEASSNSLIWGLPAAARYFLLGVISS